MIKLPQLQSFIQAITDVLDPQIEWVRNEPKRATNFKVIEVCIPMINQFLDRYSSAIYELPSADKTQITNEIQRWRALLTIKYIKEIHREEIYPNKMRPSLSLEPQRSLQFTQPKDFPEVILNCFDRILAVYVVQIKDKAIKEAVYEAYKSELGLDLRKPEESKKISDK